MCEDVLNSMWPEVDAVVYYRNATSDLEIVEKLHFFVPGRQNKHGKRLNSTNLGIWDKWVCVSAFCRVVGIVIVSDSTRAGWWKLLWFMYLPTNEILAS